MTLRLILDRFEESFGVCLDFDDKRHLIPKEILAGVEINDVFNIECDGGVYHSPIVLANETAERKETVSTKMRRLFKLTQHRRPPKL